MMDKAGDHVYATGIRKLLLAKYGFSIDKHFSEGKNSPYCEVLITPCVE
jgi:hypothetical protein